PTEVYIDVVLLQNGTPVAGNPIIGVDLTPDVLNDPYNELDLTVPVNPKQIEFATAAANPGTFVFNGNAAVIGGGMINDNQLFGSEFRVEQSGSNYQIQISIGETIADLDTAPDILLTPEFSVNPSVAEIVIVQPIRDGSSTGEPLVSNSGEPLKVILRDTNRDPIVGREVRAQIISGNTGRARPFTGRNFTAAANRMYDLNGAPIAVGAPVECLFNFATPTEKGAGLTDVTAKTGACMGGGVGIANPDRFNNTPFDASGGDVGVEDGQRIVTAETNALGEAIFTGDSALIIGTSGTNYQIQFSADDGLTPFDDFASNHGAAPFAVTPAPRNTFFNSITSNVFQVAPTQTAEVRLLDVDDPDILGGADPDTELTGGTFAVTAGAPNIVRYNDGALRDFAIGLYDKYGNRVNRTDSQIIVTKLGTGGNNLYGQQADAADSFLTDAGRTFTTRRNNNAGNSIQFVDGAPMLRGGNDLDEARLILADSNDVQYPGTNPAAATETGVRLRFTDLASGVSFTTPPFDIP
ncbi:MAG: hypothetical protein AAF267_18795, partial [Deinococcota bacterium]